MKRMKKQVAVYLTEDQNKWLSGHANKKGVSKTSVIQGLIETQMAKKVKK